MRTATRLALDRHRAPTHSELDPTNTSSISSSHNHVHHHHEAAQIPNGLEVALLLASFPSQGPIKTDTVCLGCPPNMVGNPAERPFHLVQTVQSLFKMTLLPSEAVSSQMLLIKTHFLPRILSTGGRHLPSTNRLGSLKPLSSNSTPTVHSVMNRLLHWLAGPTFNGQQRRLWSRYNASQAHGTVACSSNLGTGGPSGGRLAGRAKLRASCADADIT